MGVFIGGRKNTSAAKAALKINYFFTYILQQQFVGFYPHALYGTTWLGGAEGNGTVFSIQP